MRIKIENGPEVDGARLLMELHNHTRPFGLGVLHNIGHMSLAEARMYLDGAGEFHFDYVHGRPLKQYAHDGVLGANSRRLFDRDAGEGQFDRAVQAAVDGEREEASAE